MTRVLLINATIDLAHVRANWSVGASMPPQGLGFLASYLKMHGHEVQVMDMLVQPYGPQDLGRRLREFQPDVVGLTAFTPTVDTCRAICRFVKRHHRGIRTVLGGPHVTFLPRETLESEAAVDFVVMGEGESTMIELLEHLQHPSAVDPRQIHGLACRVGAEVWVSPPRERIECLDILPFCERDGFPLECYAGPYTLISSRGCPGQCIFCAAGALAGSRQRMRSAENVFSEVYLLVTSDDVPYLLIADDSFTVSEQRVRRFCELVRGAGLTFSWWCESRVQGIRPELLATMAEAGCVSVQFGVESGSQEVLDRIRKNMSLGRLHAVLQAARQAGISPICSLMLGHYCDTPETMQQTIDLARELRERYQAAVLVSINTVFPGTYQYEHRAELGLRLYSEAWRDFDLETVNIYTDAFDRDVLTRFYFEAQRHAATRDEVSQIFQKHLPRRAGAAEAGTVSH